MTYYYDPTDIAWIGANEEPVAVKPVATQNSLTRELDAEINARSGRDRLLGGLRTIGLPLALGYGSGLAGQAIGGEMGERVARTGQAAGTGLFLGDLAAMGVRGGARLGARVAPEAALTRTLAKGAGSKFLGKAGPIAALTLAGLEFSGLGKKLPLVGQALFGAEAPDTAETTVEDLEAYGASPSEINRIMNLRDRIEQVEGPEIADAFLDAQLVGLKERLIALDESRSFAADDALVAQAISKAVQPYRDDAITNIEIARQSAMKAGMPEVANQYFAMSKNVANAYASQAVTFGAMNRLQQTLQAQLDAQSGGGGGGGLFDTLNSSAGSLALSNQAG